MIRLQLLGAPHLARADGPDASSLLAQPKRFALMAYLAVGAGTFYRRDLLLTMFWPELDQFAARRALRNTLYQLRLALGDDVFVSRGDDEIMLDHAKLWCDVAALRDAVAAGQYDVAVDLYRGEFLDGFHVSNSGEGFEDWLTRERSDARELALRALRAVVDDAMRNGRPADAARHALRAAALAPFDEVWIRLAIVALDASGDRSGALRLYDTFTQRLAIELETKPSAETRALIDRVRAASAATAGTTSKIVTGHANQNTQNAARDVRQDLQTLLGDAKGDSKTSAGEAKGNLQTLAGEARRNSQTQAGETEENPQIRAGEAKKNAQTRAAEARQNSQSLEGEARQDPQTKAGEAKRARRWPLTVAVASALVAGAAMVWTRSTDAPSRRRVIVTVFENRTGDPKLDAIGDMVVDWTTRSILQARLVDVVDPRVLFVRGRATTGQPVDALALARRNGASTLVTGSYYKSADSLLFIASIIDVGTTAVVRSVGPLSASLARPVDGVEATRSRVLASLASILDKHFAAHWNARVAPPAFEAYSPYIEGWDEFWGGDMTRAESLFARAASSDPTFDAAQIALATAAARLGNCATVDSVTQVTRQRHRTLDPIDALNIRIASAHCHGHNDEMLNLTLERSRLVLPSSPLQVSAAGAALWANRPATVVAILRGMNPKTDLDWLPTPDHVDYWQDLTEAYHLLGQHESELEAADHTSATSTLAEVFARTRALAALHRPADALRALDSSFTLPPEPNVSTGLGPNTYGRPEYTGTPAWIALSTARELLVHGDTSAAHEAAASGIAWIDARPTADHRRMEYRTYTAWLDEVQGKLPPAIALMRQLATEDTGNVDFKGTLAGLAAASGDTATAHTLDAWLASIPRDRGEWGAPFYRARVAALLGHTDDAVSLVREALDRGAWPYFVHLDPALNTLMRRPDYVLLIAPRA